MLWGLMELRGSSSDSDTFFSRTFLCVGGWDVLFGVSISFNGWESLCCDTLLSKLLAT